MTVSRKSTLVVAVAGLLALTPAAAATAAPAPSYGASWHQSAGRHTAQELQNLAVVRSYFAEVLTKHRLDLVDRYVAKGFVQDNPGEGTGREGLKQVLGALFAAFPDSTSKVEKILADGDRVIVLNRVTGHNTGPLFGQPATGLASDELNADYYRLSGGKIVQHGDVVDYSQTAKFGITTPSTPLPSQTDFRSHYTPQEWYNIGLVRRNFEDVINGHRPERLPVYTNSTGGYIQHQASFGTTLADLQRNFAGLFQGFPDVKVTIEHVFAFGDEVVVVNTLRGTNTGSFAGRPATGRSLTYRAADWYRVANGKLTEHWAAADYSSFNSFLG